MGAAEGSGCILAPGRAFPHKARRGGTTIRARAKRGRVGWGAKMVWGAGVLRGVVVSVLKHVEDVSGSVCPQPVEQ